MNRLIIKNIGMLATPTGGAAKAGESQGKIQFIKNAFIVCDGDLITSIGEMARCTGDPVGLAATATDNGSGLTLPSWIDTFDAEIVDAEGKLVTPGLVDAHTHLGFGGWRQNELEQKLKGATYLDILAAGGGILSTVRATRGTPKEDLVNRIVYELEDMFRHGTTTCEAKSGYGLDRETELKQLTAFEETKEKTPVELVPTFMGAHALPVEYKENREEYLDFLCNDMIPHIASKGLAEFCDVFCEEGVFTAKESERILSTAKANGLGTKIHTDEIEDIGGTAVAETVGAISAEHLIRCTEKGIAHLRKGDVIACLLPGTSLYLGAEFAPARDMINAGVPVAMASDFNPGSCTSHNMQLVINLGCLKYRLTPEEVLTAVTLNAAAAIGREKRIGSLEVGKQADILIWEAPDLNYICYRMGRNLVNKVIKKGKIYG